jgi:small subunit ribosomal protein S18
MAAKGLHTKRQKREGTLDRRGRKGGPRGGAKRPDYDSPRGPRRVFRARRVCRFCKKPDIKIDYKDAKALRPFITERGKIVPRRITGNCAKHQREVCGAINRARNLAIVPFTATSLYI